MKSLFATSDDYTLALARLVLGIIFLVHGGQLALGWFHGYGYHASMHFFESIGIPALFASVAIMTQFFGAFGLLLGFLTRLSAFGIAVVMLVAIIKVHMAVGFFMNWYGAQKGEGYEYHLLAIVICILLMVKGAGALSIDRAIAKA